MSIIELRVDSKESLVVSFLCRLRPFQCTWTKVFQKSADRFLPIVHREKIRGRRHGALLILYVLGHLAGNLQIYMGPDRINAYAKFLHDLGPILWVVRVFLIAAFVTHIVATIELAQENRLAKPQKYAVAGYQRSSSGLAHDARSAG